MVFRVKANLTEEDREAWRRLALQREKARRKKRRAAVRSWIGTKIAGLGCLALGSWEVAAVVCGWINIWHLLTALLALLGAFLMLAEPYPAKQADSLPGKDFPPARLPDAPVRAAFFGDGCFVFWENGEKVRLGDSAVTAAWEDGGRFYLFFPDRPPLVLPKRGLGRWMPEDFRDFLERTLEVPVERM